MSNMPTLPFCMVCRCSMRPGPLCVVWTQSHSVCHGLRPTLSGQDTLWICVDCANAIWNGSTTLHLCEPDPLCSAYHPASELCGPDPFCLKRAHSLQWNNGTFQDLCCVDCGTNQGPLCVTVSRVRSVLNRIRPVLCVVWAHAHSTLCGPTLCGMGPGPLCMV